MRNGAPFAVCVLSMFSLLGPLGCGKDTARDAKTPLQEPANTPQFPETPTAPAPAVPERVEGTHDIRVQIFPHQGKYPQPQGREKDPTRFSITSTKLCHLSPMSGEGTLQTSRRFDFTYASVPDPVQVTCEAPATLVRDGGLTSYSYDGRIEISRSAAGDPEQLIAVNVIDLEEYVKGVVPAEIPPSWPAEALKAQAVAARTYGLYQFLNPSQKQQPAKRRLLVTIDDTIQYQAYLGHTKRTAATDDAVDATQGEILGYQGKIALTYFFADSGGHTEDASRVFGNHLAPYCQGRAEVYDLSMGPAPWSVSLSLPQMTQFLRSTGVPPAAADPRSVEVDEKARTPSGRASQVAFTLADGTTKRISASRLVQAFGLKSSLFTISGQNPWIIHGRGSGHGVGMAQYGAEILASAYSWDYRKILGFYYTGIEFEKINGD